MANQPYVTNPEAVGDPSNTPVVFGGPALAKVLGRCGAPLAVVTALSENAPTCDGVNGYHDPDCTR